MKAQIELDAFYEYVKSVEGRPLYTRAKHQPFSAKRRPSGGLVYTPASEKPRNHTEKTLRRILKQFSESPSYKTSDYQWTSSRNTSYTLALIGYYVTENGNTELEEIRDELENAGKFDPLNLEDARKTIQSAIVLRQGRAKFRRRLLADYEGMCAVSGCNVPETLEAAHIIAYLGL